ncbi:polysaccharide lyase [Cellvibrio japonicus]|uniref:Uncharacterized protein n=1 Tax=Cellvibrio japonicus (strain Ueda107) TaxID=498211 RepID=B3PEH5_CELJU|nr:polysaccharide lyase [Cellvibrio japonicus]ACE83420.1 hypothetical protein CJA_3277 [Cellvibrio japonicus Ueda107]QEI13542.1 hypothetical protein FY117_15825 [Cellvibrio japonicus]QEI17116.1 hypothetical protein FY116_15830 [Cellvibrio japonicus]QEI20693.1 hypothetical protein FY115_15825 [Cellvibrio japonicus]
MTLQHYAATLLILCSSPLQADILWRGDFETGDASQWHTGINAAGLSVTDQCSYDGRFAGRVQLTGDDMFLWNGNKQLNRSEFHHRMPEGATREGKDTFFAFAFYLPKALSQHKHELGYWESDKSWQQMFRFNIHGQSLSFQQSNQDTPFWTLDAGAAPGQWQRVALHIHWSTNPATGFVQTWVNGEDMGKYHFPTLPAKDARMFTQIGILRTQEKQPAEIWIDAALESSSLQSLLAIKSDKNKRGCE